MFSVGIEWYMFIQLSDKASFWILTRLNLTFALRSAKRTGSDLSSPGNGSWDGGYEFKILVYFLCFLKKC